MVLGQFKTEEKSNKITAIPELLNLLSIEGVAITIDAMGCQKKIAEKIIEKKANYVLVVKYNQPTLHHEIIDFWLGIKSLNIKTKSMSLNNMKRQTKVMAELRLENTLP